MRKLLLLCVFAGAISFGHRAEAQNCAGPLDKRNNLSDVCSASAVRTNLGLGTSATANIGTGVGTVAAGNDSRIAGAVQSTTLGAASGVATLDNTGNVPLAQLGNAAGSGAATNNPTFTGLMTFPFATTAQTYTLSGNSSVSTANSSDYEVITVKSPTNYVSATTGAIAPYYRLINNYINSCSNTFTPPATCNAAKTYGWYLEDDIAPIAGADANNTHTHTVAWHSRLSVKNTTASNSGDFSLYVGGQIYAWAQAVDGGGNAAIYTGSGSSIMAFNTESHLFSPALNYQANTGYEMDMAIDSGASAASNQGLNVVETATHAKRGNFVDTAIVFNNQDIPANIPAWQTLIQAGHYAHGFPAEADSTYIGILAQPFLTDYSTTGNFNFLNGIDFRTGDFSPGGVQMAGPGFEVGARGVVQTPALIFGPRNGLVVGTYADAASGQAVVQLNTLMRTNLTGMSVAGSSCLPATPTVSSVNTISGTTSGNQNAAVTISGALTCIIKAGTRLTFSKPTNKNTIIAATGAQNTIGQTLLMLNQVMPVEVGDKAVNATCIPNATFVTAVTVASPSNVINGVFNNAMQVTLSNNTSAACTVGQIITFTPPTIPNYATTPTMTAGAGAPTGSAPISSLYLQTDSAAIWQSNGTSWTSFVSGSNARYTVFVASGTFTKLSTSTFIRVVGYGAGGGGGMGGNCSATVACSGGGGGGGGTVRDVTYPSGNVPNNVTVTIGVGGAPAVSTITNGSVGSNTIFAAQRNLTAYGGGGGGFGGTANSAGGAGGSFSAGGTANGGAPGTTNGLGVAGSSGPQNGNNGLARGAAGGGAGGAIGAAGSNGGASSEGCGGGAGGGGFNAGASTAFAGGNAFAELPGGQLVITGGAVSTNGQVQSIAFAPLEHVSVGGGSGGGGTLGATGGSGGSPPVCGGGAGGGAAPGASTPGAGGTGGAGYLVVLEW